MKDSYVGILMEDMDSKLDAILESLSFMATKEALQTVDDRLARVESDLKAAIAVLTGHSQNLEDHDHRIIKLEHEVFNTGA